MYGKESNICEVVMVLDFWGVLGSTPKMRENGFTQSSFLHCIIMVRYISINNQYRRIIENNIHTFLRVCPLSLYVSRFLPYMST